MDTNIFGFRTPYEPSTDNSKLMSLSKTLQTKVNKTGDILSGSLNMGSHKITSSFIPDVDETLTNKKYVDTPTVVLNIDTAAFYGQAFKIMEATKRAKAKLAANIKL